MDSSGCSGSTSGGGCGSWLLLLPGGRRWASSWAGTRPHQTQATALCQEGEKVIDKVI